MKFSTTAIAATLGALALAGGAAAGTIPYPNAGTPNPVTYTFTAASTGEIDAYFAGSGAGYDEQVGLLVNGVSTGIVGLDDQTSNVGDMINLGAVNAGDTLTFVDYVYTSGDTWFSNPSMNSDGGNHVYSTGAAADQIYAGSPVGTYVAFEDLNFQGGSDFNYHDDTFLFTNTATVSSGGGVPEPATWGLMMIGLGCIGGAMRRRAVVTAA